MRFCRQVQLAQASKIVAGDSFYPEFRLQGPAAELRVTSTATYTCVADAAGYGLCRVLCCGCCLAALRARLKRRFSA